MSDNVIKFEYDLGETVLIPSPSLGIGGGFHGTIIMLGFDGQPHYKVSYYPANDFVESWFPEWRLEKVEQHVEEDYERLKPSMTVPLSK